METQLTPNRSFEYTIRSPFDSAHDAKDVESAQRLYYIRLMRVAIQHTYYNLSNAECPDFTISPTPSTSALMRDLGLLFQSEPSGFSILYNEKQKSSLISYLKRQGDPEPSTPPLNTAQKKTEIWTRLSFTLALNNPYFINFTDIPFDIDPGQQNFYFTNQGAHKGRGGEIILNSGDYVKGVEGLDLLNVVASQCPVDVSKSIREVIVKDISGQVVLCERRCVPSPAQKRPSLATCDYPVTSPPPTLQCRDTIFLDFSSLPEDKYRITKVFNEDMQGAEEELMPLDGEYLYTTSSPTPLCFIDLLFTNPTKDAPGIYPVRNLSQPEPEIISVTYQLKFRTRAPFWTYYIVPQPQREKFENLRIETVEPKKSKSINFSGPCCVYLANGAKGYRFISEKAIPLRQQAEYQFRLLGQHDLMTHDGVIVDKMPVASRQQLLRDHVTVLLDVNNNLCSQGNDKRCRKLVRQLGKSLRADSGFAGGMEELRRLSANPRGKQMQELRHSSLKLYSDTYVYV